MNFSIWVFETDVEILYLLIHNELDNEKDEIKHEWNNDDRGNFRFFTSYGFEAPIETLIYGSSHGLHVTFS